MKAAHRLSIPLELTVPQNDLRLIDELDRHIEELRVIRSKLANRISLRLAHGGSIQPGELSWDAAASRAKR